MRAKLRLFVPPLLAVVGLLGLAACGETPAQRATTGGAAGAGVGALVGGVPGAVLGGAAGAAGGALTSEGAD